LAPPFFKGRDFSSAVMDAPDMMIHMVRDSSLLIYDFDIKS